MHPKKTLSLVISPFLHKPNPALNLTFNYEIIQTSEIAKYLGIAFDNKLSFKIHVMFLEKKAARSVGIIAKLSSYLPSKSLLTLYYSLVHTNLLYALPIWASTCQTYLLKLKRLQNKVIRIITKAPLKSKLTPHNKKYQVLKLED